MTDTDELKQLVEDLTKAMDEIEGDEALKEQAKAKANEALALALQAADEEE